MNGPEGSIADKDMFQVVHAQSIKRLADEGRLRDIFGAEEAKRMLTEGLLWDWHGIPIRLREELTEEEANAARRHFSLPDAEPLAREDDVNLAASAMKKIRRGGYSPNAYIVRSESVSYIIEPEEPSKAIKP